MLLDPWGHIDAWIETSALYSIVSVLHHGLQLEILVERVVAAVNHLINQHLFLLICDLVYDIELRESNVRVSGENAPTKQTLSLAHALVQPKGVYYLLYGE